MLRASDWHTAKKASQIYLNPRDLLYNIRKGSSLLGGKACHVIYLSKCRPRTENIGKRFASHHWKRLINDLRKSQSMRAYHPILGGSEPFATPVYAQHTLAADGLLLVLMLVRIAVSPQLLLIPVPSFPSLRQTYKEETSA